ncbi:DNA cytosine methyltransferase [Candidatus Nomurabacteria bacterium]|nr:DNA cytosine methyltransferase [Candidatus Nomurabacteria bacterium]
MVKNKKITVVDLFSGCGGLSKGFLDAGYDVILGVDNDAPSLETFKANHGDSKILNADLFDKNAIKEIKKMAGSKVDVLVGGPPCQGFSLTGTRNFNDKRNRLYLSFIEAVEELKPEAFLIENVPGLVRMYDGAVKDEIIRRLSKIGYNVEWKILSAADYGVPQLRTRVVFVGLRKKYGKFVFPKPTNTPENYVTSSDAISDLPALENDLGEEKSEYKKTALTDYQKKMRKSAKHLYNHVSTKHTDMVKSVISLVPEGGNHKDLPPGVGTSRNFNEAWTRYHSKKPSKTIDTGHRNHFHYKYNRIPTVRENARLQSFPDDFIFMGTRTQQNRQVGNAVPPILGYHIGRQLMSFLNKKNEDKK